MIYKKYHGYGTRAIKSVLKEIRNIEGCKEVYLSTDSENIKPKSVCAGTILINS
ncbi:hypothetical protein ACSXC4_00355 [Clostridium perfringens]|uniref:hypothetical protein n=1 Tax=Clostridium perfringens TaxID=1502 RepID=UPI0013016F7B|nr:hypothetical protein [Clostridium perfringens]EIW6614393.1 hypothetical protein [Clostridium perfringens]